MVKICYKSEAQIPADTWEKGQKHPMDKEGVYKYSTAKLVDFIIITGDEKEHVLNRFENLPYPNIYAVRLMEEIVIYGELAQFITINLC